MHYRFCVLTRFVPRIYFLIRDVQQIFKARKHLCICTVREKNFIKITWCLILLIILFFRSLRIFYRKFIFFLKRDRELSNVFENITITDFKKGKILKDVLLKTKIPPLKTEEGLCGKPRCEICKYITKTHQFESSLQSAYIPSDHKI